MSDVVKKRDFKATCRKGNKNSDSENPPQKKSNIIKTELEKKASMTMLTFGHSHDGAEFFIKVTIIFFTVRCLGNYTSFTFIKVILGVSSVSDSVWWMWRLKTLQGFVANKEENNNLDELFTEFNKMRNLILYFLALKQIIDSFKIVWMIACSGWWVSQSVVSILILSRFWRFYVLKESDIKIHL